MSRLGTIAARAVAAGRETLERRPALLPVAVAAILLIPFLVGVDDLDSNGQSQQGLYVIDVLDHGHFFVPSEPGRFASKPPLYTWAAALLSLPFGSVSPFTLKLPAAIAGVLTVWVTVRIGVLVGGALLGTLSGLVLATNFHFLRLASISRPDPFLALFVTLAFLEAARAAAPDCSRPDRRYLRAWLWIGLSGLSKGPVGAGVFAFGLTPHLALRRDMESFKNLRPFLGLAIVLAFLLAWFVPAALVGGPDYVRQLLHFEMIDRVTGTGTGRDRVQPVYAYLLYLLARFQPWSLLAPAAVVVAREARSRRSTHLVLWWFLGGLIFFTLSAGKRPTYLLPIYPAAAILAALPFALPIRPVFARRNIAVLSAAFTVVGLVALAALPFTGLLAQWLPATAAPTVDLVHENIPVAVALVTPALSLSLAAHAFALRGRLAASLAAITAASGAAILVFQSFVTPLLVERDTDSHHVAEAVAHEMGDGDELLLHGAYKSSVPFRLGLNQRESSSEEIQERAGRGEGRVLVLVTDRTRAAFESRFPGFRLVFESSGTRSFPAHALFADR